jgi:steroid delta-isomerase-like uncharacterized protein
VENDGIIRGGIIMDSTSTETIEVGASCGFAPPAPTLTSGERKAEERRAEVYRSYEEIWNKGNVDSLGEFYAEEIVRRQPPMPIIEGLDAYRDYAARVLQTYPDFKATVEEVIIEGDTSVVRFTMRGTQTEHNTILDVPPTGNGVDITATAMARWANGKIIEEWANIDYLGLYQQLGLVPAPSRN